MAVWYSLWSFVIFPNLGCLDQEKSGNPEYVALLAYLPLAVVESV
jgi:hypothetical protein